MSDPFTDGEMAVLRQLIDEKLKASAKQPTFVEQSRPKLSLKTLEPLVLAVLNLRTDDDYFTDLRPEDVLQDWVVDQLPKPRHFGPGPATLPGR